MSAIHTTITVDCVYCGGQFKFFAYLDPPPEETMKIRTTRSDDQCYSHTADIVDPNYSGSDA